MSDQLATIKADVEKEISDGIITIKSKDDGEVLESYLSCNFTAAVIDAKIIEINKDPDAYWRVFYKRLIAWLLAHKHLKCFDQDKVDDLKAKLEEIEPTTITTKDVRK